MSLQTLIPGLTALQSHTLGSGVRVAILDGPVDVTHPCFEGARLSAVPTLVQEGAGPGKMSRHGTSVASIVLGQPGGPLPGVAPACTGLFVPVFQDYREGELPQLDLARAVEQAVMAGAQVINISGGQRAAGEEADPFLERAIRSCEDNNVLVVAAAGNDGCDCVHVPAALPTVLAVGALGRDGLPVASSNWGAPYRNNGLLALGEGIPGAVPGGGTAELSGTSFATPIVAGVAALLMSLQLQAHEKTDARAVREALLATATGCLPSEDVNCDRFLAGVLDVPRAHAFLLREGTREMTDANVSGTASTPPEAGDSLTTSSGGQAPADSPSYGTVAAQGWGQVPPAATFGGLVPGAAPVSSAPDGRQGWMLVPAGTIPAAPAMGAFGTPLAGVQPQQLAVPPVGYAFVPVTVNPSDASGTVGSGMAAETLVAPQDFPPATVTPRTIPAPKSPSAVRPSDSCGCDGAPGEPCRCGSAGYIYALGTIGVDYKSEACRDSFRQLMPSVVKPGAGPDGSDVFVDPNPYDVFQLYDYLEGDPADPNPNSPHRYGSTSVTWTLMQDQVPLYAIIAEPSYADSVYQVLRTAVRNQALPLDADDYVSRVSVPALKTDSTVQLFSGQVVPVIVAQRLGMYYWNEKKLIDSVIDALREGPDRLAFDEPTVRMTLRSFLEQGLLRVSESRTGASRSGAKLRRHECLPVWRPNRERPSDWTHERSGRPGLHLHSGHNRGCQESLLPPRF